MSFSPNKIKCIAYSRVISNNGKYRQTPLHPKNKFTLVYLSHNEWTGESTLYTESSESTLNSIVKLMLVVLHQLSCILIYC